MIGDGADKLPIMVYTLFPSYLSFPFYSHLCGKRNTGGREINEGLSLASVLLMNERN